MLRRLAFAGILLGTAFRAGAEAPDPKEAQPQKITSITGTTYEKAVVTAITPSAITVMHESGVARVLLKDLPPDLQAKFAYDPQKASTYEAKENQKALDAQRLSSGPSANPALDSKQPAKEVSLFQTLGNSPFNSTPILNAPVSVPSAPVSVPSGW